MKNIYYAHSIAIYGTKQEARDVEIIKRVFPDDSIINPNTPDVQSQYHGDMDIFKSIVQKCGIFVFRALPNGKIPAGIAKEIECATDVNIPIIELPCFTERTMTVDDTRQFLKETGVR